MTLHKLSDQWMLSAGHCFYEGEEPLDWVVVLGESDTMVLEGQELFLSVEKIFIHPLFDHLNIDFDLTLVKLTDKVEFTDYISPVCLPALGDDLNTTYPPGQNCIVTGWGTVDPDGTLWGPRLRQQYAELWSAEECEEAYLYYISDQMLCAGFHLTGSQDEEKCQTIGYGDSGGPLVCRNAEGLWSHIGAVS